ncbi:MAG: hypothetical protein GXO83_12215 [Chlorobi bacterium]|nr:hypothetical protein [Chlorobiota bacterium]
MRRKEGFGHIAAIFLAGIFLTQSFVFLLPDDTEVLCIAEDHIAVESPGNPAHNAQITYKISNPYYPATFYQPENRKNQDCTDIPLFTRVLKTDKTLSVKSAIRLSYSLTAYENQDVVRDTGNNVISGSGFLITCFPERRYPEESMSLLL